MQSLNYQPGSCLVQLQNGTSQPACQATLKQENNTFYRLIKSACLSRPEHYFSIYQSGCNHSCLKCHSAEFAKYQTGDWYSTDQLAQLALKYSQHITVYEPREHATMWHATDLCHSCGHCILEAQPGPLCPNTLKPEQLLLSPQGFGPARNIIAFTGGDITCQAQFYAQATQKIKELASNLWVLIETNGYGLIPQNLDLLKQAGVDAFWLDIKAYNENTYQHLCGTTNQWILKAPEEILTRGFILEILTLFIPTLVETDQIIKIAKLIANLDPATPFTLLAFFPANKLTHLRPPTLQEMLNTYYQLKETGLTNIKLGNIAVFAKSQDDLSKLISQIGPKSIG